MKPKTGGAAALTAALLAGPAQAVTLGQVDTFASGTTENWNAGGGPLGQVPPVPPSVVAAGGPAGSADSFLQIVSNGSQGPGGRLVAMNALAQWSGNYIAAGVTAISMDLKNLGNSDLSVRLYFEDPIPGPPTNEAVTSAAVLPAGSGWTHVSFAITPPALTVLQGDAATLLGNTTVLRIYSGGADFPPERITGVLGVDNVRAVPEPASAALLLGGMAAVAGVAARRRP